MHELAGTIKPKVLSRSSETSTIKIGPKKKAGTQRIEAGLIQLL